MSDEWGPWIKHDGLGCPVPVGTWVFVVGSCGAVDEARVTIKSFRKETSQWFGKKLDAFDFIVRYRVRKPSGLTVLEQIARDVPACTPELEYNE